GSGRSRRDIAMRKGSSPIRSGALALQWKHGETPGSDSREATAHDPPARTGIRWDGISDAGGSFFSVRITYPGLGCRSASRSSCRGRKLGISTDAPEWRLAQHVG